MIAPAAVEVAFPEALYAIVVKAIVTCKSSHIVSTLFALIRIPLAMPIPFLRFYDLSIGGGYQHRFVGKTITPSMHILEALKAEVIFTVCTEHLGFFDGTGGALAAVSSCDIGVVLAWPLCILVQRVPACLTKSH
jgi:hypothetical protein